MKIKTCHIPPLPSSIKDGSLLPYFNKANARIQNFKKNLESLPFPKKLLFVLKVKEACVSLKTQGVSTPLEEVLYFAFIERPKKPPKDIRYVFNYLKGMDSLEKRLSRGRINISFLETLHGILEKNSPQNLKDIGHIRKRQNWIGPKGCKIEEAFFYPPSPAKVRPLLLQLQKYIDTDQNEPLGHLGVAFAQFLIIHPFMDANGRVARLMIPAFLYKKKLLSYPFFYLSSYFLQFRKDYINKLFYSVEDRSWSDWLRFFLKGIIHEEKILSSEIGKIHHLYSFLDESLSLRLSSPRIKKFLLFLFQTPVFTEEMIHKKCHFSNIEIKKTLKWLVKQKIIKKRPRTKVYVFSKLLSIVK